MNKHDPRHKVVRAAFFLKSNDLGSRVVRGAGFTFLGIALRTVLTIGSMAILARLLTPVDFGYIAMATVVTEFAGLLGSFGLANVLVQKKSITRLQLDTVFWSSLGIGVTICFIVFSLSFTTTYIFDDEKVGSLLRVLCLTFIFGSLSTVHEAILSRLMLFRAEFIIQISAIASRSILAILLAYYGFGLWSLVAGSIFGSLLAMLLMMATIRYTPRLRFSIRYITSTLRTSGSYMGNTVLYYISTNIDLLLIGRQLGAGSLGYYQNARSLTDEVRGRIAMPLQRVLFPAFASIQSDTYRLQQSVLRSGRILAAIIFPIGIGLSATSAEIIPALYGGQWLAMTPILMMLGISAAFKGSTAIASPLFNSQNKVSLSLKYNALATLLFTISVLLAIPHGLNIVAFTIAANSIFSVVILRVALGLIGLKTRDLMHILARPILSSIFMWISIFSMRTACLSITSNFIVLLFLEIMTGVAAYAVTLHLSSRQYYLDFIQLISRFRGNRT